MCTYCGCETFEVVGRFTAEHVEVINTAGLLRRAVHDGVPREQVVALVDLVRGLLDPHTRDEEVGLFAVLREDETFADHVEGLCAEHEQLDAQLNALRAGDHSVVDRLSADLREHIHKEENGLLPAAAVGLSAQDWERVDALTPAPRHRAHR
ncbi:hemerythrin domain-containing protein [Janibacter sp. Y6]|uniref:hemerythrin domain-containing protein n=1 Tax=Janibacter sp. Y6 TaxID=2913552 RepID=UPI0034A4A787